MAVNIGYKKFAEFDVRNDPKRYTVTARRTRTRVIKSPVRLDLYGLPFVSKFLLHDIRAVFCHVYVRFIPKYMTIFLQTRIYMRTKKSLHMRYKQACGIWGYKKSSYKRHRIIPLAKTICE